MTIEAPTEAPFEITFETDDGNGVSTIDDTTIKVRWCVTPELTSRLGEKSLVDAQMLISVVHDFGEEGVYRRFVETKRYLVELTKTMETIQFSANGVNYVHAMVVWPDEDTSVGKMRSRFNSEHTGSYNETLFEYYDGSLTNKYSFRRSFGADRTEHVETRKFLVDGAYPERPTGLLADILDKWGQFDTFDQCDTRKKLMWTIPLTLMTLIPAFFAKLPGAVFALIFLLRRVNWMQLWMPLEQHSISQFYGSIHWDYGAWFFKKPLGSGYYAGAGDARSWPWFTLNPYTVIMFGTILFWASHNRVPVTGSETETTQWLSIGYWQSLAAVASIQIVLTLGILLAMAIGIAISFLGGSRVVQRIIRVLPERRKKQKMTRIEAQVQGMMCKPMAHEVDYTQVNTSGKPVKQKASLLVSRAKNSRVCRPYSRLR